MCFSRYLPSLQVVSTTHSGYLRLPLFSGYLRLPLFCMEMNQPFASSVLMHMEMLSGSVIMFLSYLLCNMSVIFLNMFTKRLYSHTTSSIQPFKNASFNLLLTCNYSHKYQQKVLICFNDISWQYGSQFLEPTRKVNTVTDRTPILLDKNICFLARAKKSFVYICSCTPMFSPLGNLFGLTLRFSTLMERRDLRAILQSNIHLLIMELLQGKQC